VLDCCGIVFSAFISRKVNCPSAPFPAKLSSPVVVLGCCRLMALGPAVPEKAVAEDEDFGC
jgi:hypothetical protein